MLKRNCILLFVSALFVIACSSIGNGQGSNAANESDVKLWYRRPAGSWNEGLPFGNGHIGGMVIGGIQAERIALNHTWLWRGKNSKDMTIPELAYKLPGIQKLFFEGDLIKAGNAANEQLTYAGSIDSFQPFGDLIIFLGGDNNVSNYRRELDLSTGVVKVSYVKGGVSYLHEVFASRTEDLIVVRISSDKPGAITGAVTLSRIDDPECKLTSWAKGNRIGFFGDFIENVSFAASAAVLNRGGKLSLEKNNAAKISVVGADEIVVLISMVPDKLADDPKGYTVSKLDGVSKSVGFEKLLSRHIKEHRRLFERVSLVFGEDSKKSIPTDERLAQFGSGDPDAGLMALHFQYGRYLLISGSKKGGVPLNLQGMWNESLKPPWGSDLHHDCNLQMNYWIAENTNLSECAEPLFEYIESMLPNARQATKNLYGCRGIWFGISGDPSAKCLKLGNGWWEWTGAAAWLAQHFWWHWEYTGDKEFLRDRVYPVYKEVGLFYEDFLVKDPRKDSPHYGKLVTVPSQSPENFFVGGVKPVSLCVGATMDFQLIYEVFTHLIDASKILGVDADKRKNWRYMLDNIPPMQVGRHGQLQEWLEDYKEGEVNHRHISHLYSIFPGDQITIDHEPELTKAARVSIDRRLVSDENRCVWPAARAWYGLVYTRMREGDLAYDLLRGNLADTSMVLSNMFSTICGGRYQIDGNFAGPALIAEMLMQSHREEIQLLPAIPKAWPNGRVTGLVARGGFEVDIEWENGKLTKGLINSRLGNTCNVRYGDKMITIKTKAGKTYKLDDNLEYQR